MEHNVGLGCGYGWNCPSHYGDALMIQVGAETTVVTGRRVYGLRVADVDPPRTVRVTVVLDGRYEWTFDEPGWRPIAVGVGETGAYLWSARRVIGLPDDGGEPRIELEVDEDLIAVFWVGGGMGHCLRDIRSARRGSDGECSDRAGFRD